MKRIWLSLRAVSLLIFGGAKKFDKFIKDHADEAVDIVDTVRDIAKNPIVLVLADAFKFKFGGKLNEILQKAGIMLDGIYDQIVKQAECLKVTDPFERLKCVTEALRGMSKVEVDQASKLMASNYLRAVSRGYTASGRAIPTSLANNIVELKVLERKLNADGAIEQKTAVA